MSGALTPGALPVDPMGRTTNIIGPTHPGPGPLQTAEPIHPEYQAEVHILPWSDKMYDPATAAEMMKPSTSALAMVGPWWRVGRNVLGDADGLGTPYDRRLDTMVGVQGMAVFTGNWMREPNLASGVPAGVKMSTLMQRFNEFLQQVQHHIIGSP